jgi:formate dehydrogenase major subunit
VHDKFEALWGVVLDPEPGLTVVEIMNAVHAGEIRGRGIMGENPAMSDPTCSMRGRHCPSSRCSSQDIS